MAKKFDGAIIEAEENLLIDYQFLLQEVMTEKGISLSDLAEKAGLTKARISQIMGPEANPTAKTFARLFFALGERVIPQLQPAARHSNVVLVPQWAPFEHTVGETFVVARSSDNELIALMKETQDEADASNDNYAPVVRMEADVMTALEAEAA